MDNSRFGSMRYSMKTNEGWEPKTNDGA
jgi:hypothetical protein